MEKTTLEQEEQVKPSQVDHVMTPRSLEALLAALVMCEWAILELYLIDINHMAVGNSGFSRLIFHL